MNRVPYLAAVILLAMSPAQSQDEPGRGSPFRLEPLKDGVLLGTAAILNATDLYLEKMVSAAPHDFDGIVLDPSTVNAFDRLFMSPYSKALDYAGTGVEVLSLLSPMVLLAASGDEWFTIGTMYAESLLLAYGLKEFGKICVRRARPFMYFGGYPQDKVDEGDWRDSFPSGHTTLAFAGAAFTSYVFCAYFPDSEMRLPVIASSYAVAVGTAALRVAGGSHFPSDVLAGAALGTVCGFVVPWIHSLDANETGGIGENPGTVSVHALPMGMLISVKY